MSAGSTTGVSHKLFFFGGTFDPPHYGHIAILKRILEIEPDSRVIVMPAAGAPLRADDRLFSYRERIALLRRLLRPELASGRVILSVLERKLPKPNYTMHTLTALAKICPQKPVIVIGADQVEKLIHWHKSAELMRDFEFLCFARRGATLARLPGLKAKFIEDFSENISATELRASLLIKPKAERFAAALALGNPP